MKNLLAAAALLLAVRAGAQTAKFWQGDRHTGEHSGITQPLVVTVKNAQQWEELWRQHDADSPAPSVDFSKHSVVVVFLGEIDTAGVKVTVVVQQDPLDSNRLNVFYRPVAAKLELSAQVICQPYAMVKVPNAATIDVEPDAPVRAPEAGAAPAIKYDGARVKALLKTPSFDAN